ncbi:MAG TPA: penicillin-binding transpeptidase domain-containing protein [Pyrinomonadaceae bacterium]|nr:penicillin-binding transpeptidase domain-containing protein [Pyrinomonadaceae bacterium]
MTLKFRSPSLIAFVISAIFLLAALPAQASAKSPKKPAAKKSAAKAAASKSAAKGKRGRAETASRKDSRSSKRERAAASKKGKNDRRSSKSERAAARRGRDSRASKVAQKDTRKMSKRERMIAGRREAERRRREAAERARQAAIARALYLARIRAQDQALRDETVANIMKDETTGEDLDIRRAAVNALGSRAGTVVVMNPKTGQVYTVVNQDWGLRRGYKPCSTVKIVTGLAGLSESVIDPVQTVNIGTSSFSLDLTDSLALSNNGYFQRVGGEVGFDKMMTYARKLGLGEPTGINHKFESPGRLPVFKQGYAVNHMSSHGDDIEVTAIQLANMTSAIANGGKLLVPHLPRTPEENVNFKRVVKREVEIPQENVNRILPGMIGAVNYGTAKRAYDPLQTIAGKTGSCIEQSPTRPWLGLFTSYAPVHDPKLAVTVILRGSGARGKWASAVAGDIYRNLHERIGIRPGAQPALANDMLAPRTPRIDPRKAAEVSDEEKEDEAAQDAFVVSESGENGAQTNNAQPGLQKTSNIVERPTPALTKPTATPTPAPAQTPTSGTERPRRVFVKP